MSTLPDIAATEDPGRHLRVFLAVPSPLVAGPQEDSVLTLTMRTRIDAVHRGLLSAGVSVFSALHADAWVAEGAGPQRPESSVYQALRGADVMFAYLAPATRMSPTITLEVGWASALRKPLVLLLDGDMQPQNLIKTLDDVSPVLPLQYESWWGDLHLRHTLVTALDWADETTLALDDEARFLFAGTA